MPSQGPERPWRAVFISPAWPAEFVSHLPWRTPEAAASYAAFLLDEPEA